MTSHKTLIHGNLWDGARAVFEKGWLLIEDGTIRDVGEGLPQMAIDATIVDATGKFLVPGLIDAHNHLFLDPGSFEEMSEVPEGRMMERMKRNAETHVRDGVAAMRECGTPHYLDLKLKQEISAGKVLGPELFACGEWLTSPDGHGAFPGCAQIVKGENEAREAVRRVADHGAAYIKVMVTGGNATKWAPPDKIFFTENELEAIHDEAEKHQLAVAAHVHCAEGARMCVQAGIYQIEHGSLITDNETIALLAKCHAIWTFNQHQRMAPPDPKMPDYKRKRTLEGKEKSVVAVQKALKAGICMCAGCDGYHENSAMVWALEGMVQSGATSAQALQMGTWNPGQAFFQRRRGIFAAGNPADVLICAEDPSQNISALRNLLFVMHDGSIIKDVM